MTAHTMDSLEFFGMYMKLDWCGLCHRVTGTNRKRGCTECELWAYTTGRYDGRHIKSLRATGKRM